MKLRQIEIHDQIFGVVFKYKEMGQLKDTDKIRAELRPMELELLQLRKDESKHRLKRMEEVAAAEKRNLESLEATGEKLVDGYVQQDIDSSERLMGPFNLRRRDRAGDR